MTNRLLLSTKAGGSLHLQLSYHTYQTSIISFRTEPNKSNSVEKHSEFEVYKLFCASAIFLLMLLLSAVILERH